MKRITTLLLASFLTVGMLLPGTAVMADENDALAIGEDEALIEEESDEQIITEESDEPLFAEEDSETLPQAEPVTDFGASDDKMTYKGAEKFDNGDGYSGYLLKIEPGDRLDIEGSVLYNGKPITTADFYWVGPVGAKRNDDGTYSDDFNIDREAIMTSEYNNGEWNHTAVGPGVVMVAVNHRNNEDGFNLWVDIQVPISEATVSSVKNATYSGKAVKPSPTVRYGDETLVKGTDYSVTYRDGEGNNVSAPTNAGTYMAVITGEGNYKGATEVSFKINRKKITPSVTLSKKSYTYDGKVKKPAVTVKAGNRKLKANRDYTVKYSSGRKNVGTYSVCVTLKGNYSGSKKATFKINKAKNPLVIKNSSMSYKRTKLTKAAAFSIGASKAKGKITYTPDSKAKKAGIAVTSKGKVTVPKKCKKGTYKITVKAAGTKNYKAGKKTVTITIK